MNPANLVHKATGSPYNFRQLRVPHSESLHAFSLPDCSSEPGGKVITIRGPQHDPAAPDSKRSEPCVFASADDW